jgi:hypothetical protein
MNEGVNEQNQGKIKEKRSKPIKNKLNKNHKEGGGGEGKIKKEHHLVVHCGTSSLSDKENVQLMGQCYPVRLFRVKHNKYTLPL